MNDLLRVLQSGDLAGLELEKARSAVDAARAALDESVKFEFAKQAFEDVVQAAEEAGLPRAKFKKLIEERTAGLWTSGLVGDLGAATPKVTKAPRAPKKKTNDEVAAEDFSEANVIDFESATASEVEFAN